MSQSFKDTLSGSGIQLILNYNKFIAATIDSHDTIYDTIAKPESHEMQWTEMGIIISSALKNSSGSGSQLAY